MEIEIFGHGALCMAVSGKCYLSLHSHNSSANRGACKQNCRKKYTVIDQESGFEIELDNEYMMSPKDLCTIGFFRPNCRCWCKGSENGRKRKSARICSNGD